MVFPSKTFWRNKKVLVTGHTGFKGSWLSFILTEIGADVSGISLAPIGSKSLHFELNLRDRLRRDLRIDLRKFGDLRRAIEEIRPEVIFHLAAQSLVLRGYQSPVATLSTNVMGTVNLFETVRQIGSPSAIISITTDKVYANSGNGTVFNELDALGGHDPYSASKAAADLVSQMYSSAYLSELKVPVGIARAGNVIGGGDWSENRLFPDLVRAWSSNVPTSLRLPQATRPWQHVLEPLHGYMVLAEKLDGNPEMSGAFNFGPDPADCLTVEEVVQIATQFWPGSPGWTTGVEDPFHESTNLAIDNSRARDFLGVVPIWKSETAIQRTTQWYREFYAGASAETLCREDIVAFRETT